MIVSWAQNLEDVMLWRAMSGIKNGFYIDVGAQHPSEHSVTKLFYDSGWRGINIEPIEQWYNMLADERPRDINLRVGAGERSYISTMHEFPDTGLSTLDDAIADKHVASGNFKATSIKVEIQKLSDICSAHAHDTINFLKIDVEGAEKSVLLGMDFTQFRPWVILVESTLPLSQEQSYEAWEDLLTDAGYLFAYFDGLNRFYLSTEKYKELSGHFKSPPNVFDNYEPCRMTASRASIDQLQLQVAELETSLNTLQQELNASKQETKQTAKREKIAKQEGNQLQLQVAELEASLNTLQQEINASEQEIKETVEREKSAKKEIDQLRSRLSEAEDEARKAHKRTALVLIEKKAAIDLASQEQKIYFARELQKYEDTIGQIYNSASWKLTRPARVLAAPLTDFFQKVQSSKRRFSIAKPDLLQHSALQTRPGNEQVTLFIADTPELSPRAQKIYSELKYALAARNNGSDRCA